MSKRRNKTLHPYALACYEALNLKKDTDLVSLNAIREITEHAESIKIEIPVQYALDAIDFRIKEVSTILTEITNPSENL